MMYRISLLTLSILLSNTLYADIEEGKELFNDSNCLSCHKMEQFKYRVNKVDSLDKLHKVVNACASNTNAGLFEEEANEVAKYLNHDFYHFKVKK